MTIRTLEFDLLILVYVFVVSTGIVTVILGGIESSAFSVAGQAAGS